MPLLPPDVANFIKPLRRWRQRLAPQRNDRQRPACAAAASYVTCHRSLRETAGVGLREVQLSAEDAVLAFVAEEDRFSPTPHPFATLSPNHWIAALEPSAQWIQFGVVVWYESGRMCVKRMANIREVTVR